MKHELQQNIQKQKRILESNLVVNAGADNGIGQELGKTVSSLMEAEAGTVVLFKDHDSVRDKLSYDNYPYDPAWVKGLRKFLREEVTLEPHIEQKVEEMFERGIPNSVIKGQLPDDVVEEYEDQIPIVDGELTRPVWTVHNFVDHSDLMNGADKVVWEEDPHKLKIFDLTLSSKEILDLCEEYVKPEVPQDVWETFAQDLYSFMPFELAKATLDFDTTSAKKITYSDNGTRHAHSIHEGTSSLTPSFGDWKRTASIILRWLNENREEGRKKLTGKIAEAIEEEDIEKASEISELLRNLRTLEELQYTYKVTTNLRKKDGEWVKGKNPFTGKFSYATGFRQYIEELEALDANVQINYAEATEELIDNQTINYDWFTIEADDPVCNITALTHDVRGGSYAKSKMKKSKKKRMMPEAIGKTFEAEGKKVGIVTYSEFVRDNKYNTTDYPALYFWNSKGKNNLDDRDVLIVAGSPNVKWNVLAMEHLKHYGAFPESMVWDEREGLHVPHDYMDTEHSINGFDEDTLDIIYTHVVKKELRDASQRLRGQRTDEEKHLVMLGYCPDLIYQHYPEEQRDRSDAYTFMRERLSEVMEEREEVPGALRELPFLLDTNALPQGLHKKDGELVKTEKYVTGKEQQLIEDLKDVGKLEWAVAKNHYGQRKHTKGVIEESDVLKMEKKGRRKFVTLE